MEKLMKAKNTNTDPDSRTTPESLMKDYFSRNSDDMRELVRQKLPKNAKKVLIKLVDTITKNLTKMILLELN